MVRIYHAGRSSAHRARDRALAAAGIDLTLIVPDLWPDSDAESRLSPERFPVIELGTKRSGDVNRHTYADPERLRAAILDARPDVLDIQEEPFSAVAHQVLSVTPPTLPIVMYTAQNVDKRYPPPFGRWEQQAYRRASAIYPCSRQAASFVRGRGYTGDVSVIPLGFDPDVFRAGHQHHGDDPLQMALVGRLVPEKGVRDAVFAAAAVEAHRPVRLVLAGRGPEGALLPRYVRAAGLSPEAVVRHDWLSIDQVAQIYRRGHVVIAPSLPTWRIVEQFGRMVPEAQASGSVVLGYATGALPEVFSGAGILSSAGDVVGLSRAAVDLALSAPLWSKLRDQGFEVASSKSWLAVASHMLQMYEVARRSTRPRGTAFTGRLQAKTEFGATATTLGDLQRPFAVPVLRRSRHLPRMIDRLTGR